MLQVDRDNTEETLKRVLNSERMQIDSGNMCTTLKRLIDEGLRLLEDPYVEPFVYHESANAFIGPVDYAINHLKDHDKGPVQEQLSELVRQAEEVRDKLEQQYDKWCKFVKERDAIGDSLQKMRNAIDVITKKGLRPFETLVSDLEELVVRVYNRFQKP